MTWSHRDKPISEMAKASGTCLQECGVVSVRRSHGYFYQVQKELAITNCSYEDFFLMSSVDDHLERINFDDTLWESALSKLRAFFADFILPELFTRKLRMKLIVKQIRNANANTTKPEYSIIVQTWRVTSRT